MTVIAVLAALAAAASFGVAAVLQHRQAREAARNEALRFRLLTDLARRPLWLAGIALQTGGYGLQALALAFGPLALVAPIVATDLLFAVPLATWWSRRRMRGHDYVGCGLVAGGMGVFLMVSPPSSGRSDASVREWLPVFGIVMLLCLAAVTLGHGRGEAIRAGLIATAAGVLFGLTAAVTLSLARLVRGVGVPAFLGHWQPWALITLGLAGLLLSQSAFQAGQLTASLPIIDTVEPMSGVLIGTAVFHEQLAASPSLLALQLSGAAVAVAGIALLAPSAAPLANGVTEPTHARISGADRACNDGAAFLYVTAGWGCVREKGRSRLLACGDLRRAGRAGGRRDSPPIV